MPPAQNQLSSNLRSEDVEFYFHKIARRLTGNFTSDFWTKLVMQLSFTEPAIHHAVRAIGAAHRRTGNGSSSPSMELLGVSPLALKEASTAMRHLSNRIQMDPTSNLVSLVASILFTCLEFVQGNADSALVHVENGLKILNAGRRASGIPSSDLVIIDKEIVPIFSRLNFLCILFGQQLPELIPSPQVDKGPFTTLEEARTKLFQIVDQAIRLIRILCPLAYAFEVGFEHLVQKAKLESEFQEWHRHLEDLVHKITAADQIPDENAVALLQIHHCIMTIWLAISASVEETITDMHTTSFEYVVDLATKILPNLRSTTAPDEAEDFCFDMQLIAPLYFVAIKCRVPLLRRRALEIIRQSPPREGLWNAYIATRMAEKCIEVEERGLMEGTDVPPESTRLHQNSLVSQAKFGNTSDITKPPSTFLDMHRHWIMPNRVAQTRFPLMMGTKPWGCLGDWHIFVEDVTL